MIEIYMILFKRSDVVEGRRRLSKITFHKKHMQNFMFVS